MKKCLLLLAAIMAFTTLQAQWTDNTDDNTFIANAPSSATEIYLSTNELSGDTYVQWDAGASNGWAPNLQRVDFDGVPQWGKDGIHISEIEFSSYSEGVSMTTTADGGVVSCFADYDGYTYAVKINADGTYAWEEHCIKLFDGMGFSRTELAAGNDGGFWALGSDYNKSYVQYVNADGTLNNTNTIQSDKSCIFGQLTVSYDNNVFLTYEKLGSGFFTDKEIRLIGFNTEGEVICEDVQLMAPQTFQSTYIHNVLPDGMGGGYVYIWHSGMDDTFNTYVFHFDENGTPTISDPNGVSVHSLDPAYFYLDANATVDPISHDILLAYLQVNSDSQSNSSIFINKITSTGEKEWEEGIEVFDAGNLPISDLLIDAFEDGSGFSIIFNKGTGPTTNTSTIEALGFDMKGGQIWSTTLSSNTISRSVCENSTGYHGGQNIVVWTDTSNGDLYGQNIQPNGALGTIPVGCPGPENFQASYTYDMETSSFGVLLNWDRPEEAVDYYVLYRTEQSTGEVIETEINGDAITYYDDSGIGTFKYQLKALYSDLDCGLSLPATTPDGDDTVFVEVTNTEEYSCEAISKILKIYTMNGQVINASNVQQLKPGIYIIQGLTHDGKLISQKTLVRQE